MRLLFWILPLIFLIGCTAPRAEDNSDTLMSVTIIDRNGFNETISTEDRLRQYATVNFLSPNPYEKVTRIFGRNIEGCLPAIVTSYHPNGQPKQYLEALDGRAFGAYLEWHPNGVPKLSAYVIGGIGDIESGAESSWLFEGMSQAWDEEGHLLAEIPYQKGVIEGSAKYYHAKGSLWREIPYHQNKIDGVLKTFTENGDLLQSSQYTDGIVNGPTLRYWNCNQISSEENFHGGKLISAKYNDLQGHELGGVHDGEGLKVTFGKQHVAETHTIKDGVQHGEVKVFSPGGALQRRYTSFNGIKSGEEIIYNEKGMQTQPKVSIPWQDGVIQGIAKTWYPNGTLESQREFSSNKKNGLSTAWYANGSVMMIEEYEKDLLIKGEYYRKGERSTVSTVEKGEGTATIFDSEGLLLRKVNYREGKPSS